MFFKNLLGVLAAVLAAIVMVVAPTTMVSAEKAGGAPRVSDNAPIRMSITAPRAVRTRSVFTARVLMDSGRQSVDAAMATVVYDPTMMRVSGVVLGDCARTMPTVLLNTVNAVKGEVGLAYGRLPGAPVQPGSCTMGTIVFTAVRAGYAQLGFENFYGVQAAFDGSKLPVSTLGAVVAIRGR